MILVWGTKRTEARRTVIAFGSCFECVSEEGEKELARPGGTHAPSFDYRQTLSGVRYVHLANSRCSRTREWILIQPAQFWVFFYFICFCLFVFFFSFSSQIVLSGFINESIPTYNNTIFPWASNKSTYMRRSKYQVYDVVGRLTL